MTSDARPALTGTTPDGHDRHEDAQGGLYQAPDGDARRSALNTNDLRGKILRITVKDGDITPAEANKQLRAARTRCPPETCSRSSAAAAGQDRARGLRDGLPEPVPDPGRRERRRLRERLLAGLATSAAVPRPGGHGPRRDRPQAGELRLAALLLDRPALLPVELQQLESLPTTVGAGRPTAAATTAARGPHNDSTGTLNGGPARLARPRRPRRSPTRTSGTRTTTTARRFRSARRASPTTGRQRADRTGPDERVPAAVPGAVHRRSRAARAAKYDYNPENPNPTKFPPY